MEDRHHLVLPIRAFPQRGGCRDPADDPAALWPWREPLAASGELALARRDSGSRP